MYNSRLVIKFYKINKAQKFFFDKLLEKNVIFNFKNFLDYLNLFLMRIKYINLI